MLITYLELMHAGDAPLASPHTPALSKSKFIGLFLPALLPRRVSSSTGDTGFSLQHEAAADLTRSGNDAMFEVNASKVSH